MREVMEIPDNYRPYSFRVLPPSRYGLLNLMTGSGKADFVITGQWANKACEVARYGQYRRQFEG